MCMGGGEDAMLLGWIPFFLFCSVYTLSASVLHTCIFMYITCGHLSELLVGVAPHSGCSYVLCGLVRSF